MLTFSNPKDRKGALNVGTKTFLFEYNFGPDKCNLDFADKRTLPIGAIGRVQVYSYEYLNKDTIIFSVDKEFDYTTEQVLTNVKYIFSRI